MDIEHEQFTARNYALGSLWMIGVFGPGLFVIGWCVYKFFA